MKPSTTSAQTLAAALCSELWYAQCEPEFQAALLTLGRLWVLSDGERLFHRGAVEGALCCVTAGALRVGGLQDSGQETLLAFIEPYQWLGEISLIDGQPRSHDVVADGDTTVLLVPRDELLDWLAQHPVHWRSVARLASSKLRLMFSALEDIAQLPLDLRLAKRLWLVAQGYGGRTGAPRRLIRLPQEQLALMLGVSRQTINKALHGLEQRGWLHLRYGTIELLDLDALRAVSEGWDGSDPAGGSSR